MLKYVDYDIVFQEIPSEVTLSINISGCPNRCEGCHSPWLWNDLGEELNERALGDLLTRYGTSITCVCFMGGDNSPREVERLARFVHQSYPLKTGWYSGRDALPHGFDLATLDYLKLGPYDPTRGALTSPTTNQRFYSLQNGKQTDITNIFTKNGAKQQPLAARDH